MDRDELSSWLRLVLTPGVGNDSARRLLAAFGLPQDIFAQSSASLRQLVSGAQASALLTPAEELADLVETTWAWLQGAEAESVGRAIVSLGDAAYPQSLLATEDPPLMLYLLGQTQLIGDLKPNRPPALTHQALAASKTEATTTETDWPLRALAMVGSRNPTPQGRLNAEQFARAFSGAGLTVVSGLALGVDGAAHEGALKASPEDEAPARLRTVAVIGTGIDRVYPRQHRELAHRIARHGLIVSEYPLGTPPLAANFPKRNRLIAGLSQGTLVVEAALQSGSLITARLASEQGKEVFAIPGSIHSPQSRGCHALLRQGAKLVETAQDVLEELRWPFAPNATNKEAVSACPESAGGAFDHEDELLQAIGADPVSLDALQARTGIDTATLQARLLTLELDGLVGRLPGGLFQRLARG